MSSQHLYIYGIHSVTAVLRQHPEQVEEIYYSANATKVKEIIKLAQQNNITLVEASTSKLMQLSNEGNHQGVVVKCKAKQTKFDIMDILQRETNPFFLILDGVQDPHNLGACLRTAEAAGVHAVIAPKDNSVGLTATVRKVACGAAEVIPFIQVTNLARTLKELKENGVWLYGADDEAAQTIYECNLQSGGIAMVMGAEGKGLRHLTKQLCDYMIKIPMAGYVSSLNVSVATGICLFEVVRQRI